MTKTYHLCGLSGGKDSTATAIYMATKHPEIDMHYFFCDTGAELPEVYETLKLFEKVFDKKIKYLKHKDGYDLKRSIHEGPHYGFLPSRLRRYCTQEQKLLPMENYFLQLSNGGQNTIISYVGLRADETGRMGWTGKLANLQNIFVKYPLREADMGIEDVYNLLEKYDALPKYYNWRSHGGCFFCFYQRQGDWLGLLETHPKLFYEAVRMEEGTIKEGNKPYRFNGGFTLRELMENKDLQSKVRKQREKQMQELKLSRKQLNLFKADNLTGASNDTEACRNDKICFACHK